MSLTTGCVELTSRRFNSGFCQLELDACVKNSLTGSTFSCRVDISKSKMKFLKRSLDLVLKNLKFSLICELLLEFSWH